MVSLPLDWNALIILLRRQFADRCYGLTDHATSRCEVRTISIHDIENCVLTGRIIEEQKGVRDPKVLVQGDKRDGTSFYIVVAITPDKPWVITVCDIDENVWEVVEGLIKRR